MDGIRFINSKLHGVLDYIVGVALILAPNLFGFADESDAAVWIPRIIGAMILLMAVSTRFELGILKLIPFPTHLMIDYPTGLFLAASPFLFGFSDEETNVWLPHVLVGLFIFLSTLMTMPRAGTVNAPYTDYDRGRANLNRPR